MSTTAPTDLLMDALVQSAFDTMAALTRLAAEHDLSLTQLRLLGILRDPIGRRLRVTTLAEYLGLEKSTMTGLVARAEARGLLGRSASPDDRRAVEVSLTDVGHELGDRVHTILIERLAPRTATLAPADRDRLTRLLTRTLVEVLSDPPSAGFSGVKPERFQGTVSSVGA